MEDPNVNAQILVELKRLNKLTFRGIIWTIIALVVVLGYFAIRVHSWSSSHKETGTTWYNYYRNDMERLDYDQAITHTKAFVNKAPSYYYPHACLGVAYSAKGDFENAKKEFETAYALWPSDDNEKNLKIVEKRIEMEQTKKK